MKRTIIMLSLTLLVLGLSATLTLRFSPPEVQLNQFSTLSFDPVSPESQPILTSLTITNGPTAQKIKMQVGLKWNGDYVINPDQIRFISIDTWDANHSETITNRDLVTENESMYFYTDGPMNIDIMESLESYSLLESAALTGYFPDGVLQLEISVKGENSANWEATSIFNIRIRNAGAIHLVSPGKQIGQVAQDLGSLPVSFFWNSVNTGFNDQYLVVKEFAPNSPPELSNIDHSGSVAYRSPEAVSSGFSDYIPFNDGHYYAWKVYMQLHDEHGSGASGPMLESRWFVFRYVADQEADEDQGDVQAILNLLQNPALINLINLGYTPTGEVIYNGRTYTGQDALDLLNSLLGKEIEVNIQD